MEPAALCRFNLNFEFGAPDIACRADTAKEEIALQILKCGPCH